VFTLCSSLVKKIVTFITSFDLPCPKPNEIWDTIKYSKTLFVGTIDFIALELLTWNEKLIFYKLAKPLIKLDLYTFERIKRFNYLSITFDTTQQIVFRERVKCSQ